MSTANSRQLTLTIADRRVHELLMGFREVTEIETHIGTAKTRSSQSCRQVGLLTHRRPLCGELRCGFEGVRVKCNALRDLRGPGVLAVSIYPPATVPYCGGGEFHGASTESLIAPGHRGLDLSTVNCQLLTVDYFRFQISTTTTAMSPSPTSRIASSCTARMKK